MQSIQSQLKFRFAIIEHKRLLIIFVGLSITIFSACTDQPSTSAVKQPTATPYVLMLFTIPSDEFGIVVDENNQVLEIAAGSAAEQSGMQEGGAIRYRPITTGATRKCADAHSRIFTPRFLLSTVHSPLACYGVHHKQPMTEA